MSRKGFNMHPHLLVQTIRNQAGSLSKAILESIMNSVDAGASRVDVSWDLKRIVIKDDGRGFQSEKEVDEWFATFGSPHVEGDAEFGRFRIGRGQGFVFGKQIWRTGTFQMSVDIGSESATELGYEWDHGLELLNGCEITTELYKPSKLMEHRAAISELTEMICYLETPIYINGKKVNKVLDFTLETEDAYFKLKEGTNLKIYHKGIFICNRGSYFCGGLGGIVNAKNNLILNQARNAILESECTMWRSIKRTISQESIRLGLSKKKKGMTDSTRSGIIRQIISGAIDDPHELNKIINLKLIPMAPRGYKSIGQIISECINAKAISFAFFNNQELLLSETIHNEKQHLKQPVILIKSKLFQWLGGDSKYFKNLLLGVMPCFDREIEKIKQIIKDWDSIQRTGKDIIDKEFKDFNMYKTIPNKDLSTSEKIWFSHIKSEFPHIEFIVRNTQYELNGLSDNTYNRRSLFVGESPCADGWTNGKNVWLHRKYLKNPDFTTFCHAMNVLVHEFCHADKDIAEEVHDYDFYKLYHNATHQLDFGRFFKSYSHSIMKHHDKNLKILNKQLKNITDQENLEDVDVYHPLSELKDTKQEMDTEQELTIIQKTEVNDNDNEKISTKSFSHIMF